MGLTMEAIEDKLSKNEQEHLTIMEKMDKFGDKLESISIKLAQLPDEVLKRADERYASKTAEKVIYGLVGVVCSAFLLAIWELIKKGIG